MPPGEGKPTRKSSIDRDLAVVHAARVQAAAGVPMARQVMNPPPCAEEDAALHRWLDLTQEEPLEPDLAICDPHHHLW